MNNRFEELAWKAMNLVQRYAAKNDAGMVARLAPIPAKLERLQAQQQEIDRELDRVRNLLETSSAPPSTFTGSTDSSDPPPFVPNGRSDRTKLRIEIDWSRIERGGGKEVICEHMASDSLVRFVAGIYEKRGIDALERLSRLSISRGPFVTNRPEVDYRNNASGTLFQHKPISDSGYWVLTHSQTSQKVSDIEVAWYRSLGFPPGSMKVEAVAK